MIKINVDAALNPSNSTIAVVARDWRRELIFACSKKVNTCCKIAEAQITKINCENILGLRKISKLTIGTKEKINPKENRHKTPRFTWFGNSLHPRVTTNKFHYNKFGIIQIGVEALSQTQIPIHPNSSLSQIQNQRTKYKPRNQRFINTKYKLHTNQRESQSKFKSCNASRESKSTNHKTKPSSNKPLSLFQIAIHIYQITKQRESIFLTHTHTLSLFSFSLIFHNSTMLI